MPNTILLGTTSDREPVALTDADRRLGIYVIGQMGVGKSTLILNMVLQDLESPDGLCVIDPHGDLINDILARVKDPSRVVFLDPTHWKRPFGINIFECLDRDNPLERTRTVDYAMNVFRKLWGEHGISPSWGINIQELLSHICQSFVALGGLTLLDVPLFLENETFRNQFLPQLRPQLQQFWEGYNQRTDQRTYASSTLNKVRVFTDNEIVAPIIGQTHSTFSIAEIMETGKALLVRLPEGQLGAEVVSLLGSLIVGQILNHTLRRVEQETATRRPFSLYCDEYQLFATSDFSRFFTEGRKFGIRTTVAHQARYQLDSVSKEVTAVAGNRIAFRVSPSDVPELKRWFSGGQRGGRLVYDVIGYIQKHGHPHPGMRRLVEKWLNPIQHARLTEDVRDRVVGLTYTVKYKKLDLVKPFFREVNSYFYTSMSGQDAVATTTIWDFVHSKEAFRKFLRTHPMVTDPTRGLSHLMREIILASEYLAEHPIYENRTSIPIDETTDLTLLPVGQAVIRYVNRGQPIDDQLYVPLPPPIVPLDRPKHVAYYVRDREEVEREILERQHIVHDKPNRRFKRTT